MATAIRVKMNAFVQEIVVHHRAVNPNFVMTALTTIVTNLLTVMIRIAPRMRHVYVPQRVILAHQVLSAVPVNVTLLKEYANRFHITKVIVK
jgi:hypothetical protein